MRLTPLAKGFVAVMVIGVVGFLAWHYRGRSAPVAVATDGGAPTGPPAKRSPKKIIVGVNDFGGAYPGVVANRGAVAGPGSRFAAAGLDVEIKLIRGSKERLAAFDSGEVDVMLLTLDYLANLAPIYKAKGADLRAFLMADWSRGNLGIVTHPKYTSIESLRDAKVATTRNTPTHYFLLSLLKRSNLKPAEIDAAKSNLVFATKTPQAGEMFQRGEVDAVAIWEPHLSQAMAGGKGKLLVSTTTATNLIADVLFARADWIAAHESELPAFARAWFEGVAELERDPSGSVETIAKAFQQGVEETRGVLGKIKPATFADNRVFFGLDRERSPFAALFEDAARFWQREGVIKELPHAADARWVKALEALAKEHVQDKVVEKFAFAAGPKKGAAPLLTKSVSIYFATASDSLGPNGKQIIDAFAETLAEFGNAFIRVEGNTDNVGSRSKNVELSRRRAAAVVEHLVSHHGIDRARFQAVGNGPDKAVGDNKTEPGREMNRRTDFQIIAND